MPAFQIQIASDGALDGLTSFAWPSALPTPTNGVYVMAAGANTDVGIVDLDAIPSNSDQLKGWWLKALHIEAPRGPVGAVALRAKMICPSQNIDAELMPDLIASDLAASTTGMIMGLRTLFPEALLPRGARLQLMGATTSSFETPVDGPYNVYFEIEPIESDAMFVAVSNVVNMAKNKARARGFRFSSFQGTAANGTDRFTVTRRCILTRARVSSATTPAAGESMAFSFERIANGGADAGTVIGAVTLGPPYTANNLRFMTIDATAGTTWFQPGDQIRIVRTYTAGGGPTPIVNTLADLEFTPLDSRIVESESITI